MRPEGWRRPAAMVAPIAGAAQVRRMLGVEQLLGFAEVAAVAGHSGEPTVR